MLPEAVACRVVTPLNIIGWPCVFLLVGGAALYGLD